MSIIPKRKMKVKFEVKKTNKKEFVIGLIGWTIVVGAIVYLIIK